jgi:hypothetical protein
VTLGTTNKKTLYALGVLGVILAYTFYDNVLSTPSAPRQATTTPATTTVVRTDFERPGPPKGQRARTEDWHPVYRSKRVEDRIDPAKVDPTLHTEKLSKVMGVDLTGGARNLFAFSAAPPPKAADLPKGPEPKIAKVFGPFPVKPPAPPPPPAPEPPPPPINLKFYGYSTLRVDGKRTAYFLDGDEILIAKEGDTLKQHYKVVRISPTSALMEDTQSKKQQTVPLTPEDKGA